jgi:hypothetical protein
MTTERRIPCKTRNEPTSCRRRQDSVVEGELVDEGMAEAIRRMRACGMAKKAIARELGLDIKTVRKWLATEWKPQRRERDEPALAKYDEWIRKRFPEVGYSAKVLHRELGELGYEGSYVTAQRYVRRRHGRRRSRRWRRRATRRRRARRRRWTGEC